MEGRIQMERRVKNLVFSHLLDNFLRVLTYSLLTILALKISREFIYPLSLKRDFAMGVFMIYSLYFLRKLYLAIDRDVLKDLRVLEESIKNDDYNKTLTSQSLT